MDLLNASMRQDEELRMQVDTEVVPQTEHWRSGVGQVLDWFGLGVDYDAILAQAENSFAKNAALQGSVGSANGAVKSFLRMSQRLSEKLLAKEKKKMHDMMAAILADEDKTMEEKKAAIRAMRRKPKKSRRSCSKRRSSSSRRSSPRRSPSTSSA